AVGQAVRGIIVIGHVGHAGIGMGGRIAERSALSLIIKTVPRRLQKDIAVVVVGVFRLGQDIVVAADGGSIAPGAVAVSIRCIDHRRSSGSVVTRFGGRGAWRRSFQNKAAVVVPGVRCKAIGGHRALGLIDAVDIALV